MEHTRKLFWNAASMLIIFSLLLSAMFVFGATPAFAQTEPPEDPETVTAETLTLDRDLKVEEVGQAEPETAALMAKALTEGSVGIIVVLNVAEAPDSAFGQSPDEPVMVYAAAQDALLRTLAGRSVENVHKYQNFPLMAMRVDAAALRALLRHHMVAAVQEDHINYPTLTESTELIGGNEAASLGFTGAGYTVAIIDTGVQANHPFLAGKVVAEACFSGDGDVSDSTCPNGQLAQYGAGAAAPSDEHGTHVAGIAAGSGASMNGVARGANIIAFNVFTNHPLGLVTFDSDYIQALDYTYSLRFSHNIASVNMSLGGGGYTKYCDKVVPATKKAIDRLRSANIATVIASGNNGYTNAISRPACVSTAISVGSTNKSDVVSDYSNYASFLNLLAPGEDIYSSIPGSAYDTFKGTSMAAPQVAGAWAVLRQALPTKITVPTVLSILKTTGVPVKDYRNGKVKPRINVAFAIGKYNKPQSAPTLVTPPDGATVNNSTAELTWNKVLLANKYKVVIKLNGVSTKVSKTYNAADICALDGTCTAHVSTILKTGMYTWTVQPFSFAGAGPVSLQRTFYTPTSVPGAVELTYPVNPIGYYSPSFEWTETGLPSGDKYYVKIYRDGKRIFSKTYEAIKICSYDGYCRLNQPLVLKEGAYMWSVQPWNPVGYGAVYSANFDFHASNGYSNHFDDSLEGFTRLYPAGKLINWWWLNGASELVTWYGYNYTWTSARIDATYANVDVTAVMYRDGSPYNSNGIIIRGTPTLVGREKGWKNGYRFFYANNGQFSAWKSYNGKTYMLQGWTYSSAIAQHDTNTLRVRAVGPNMQFYINGTLVWSGADYASGPDLTSGSVGIQSYLADWSDYYDYLYIDSISTTVPLTLSLGEESVSAEQLALNEAAMANPVGSPLGPDVSMADYEFMMSMPERPAITFEQKMQMCMDAGLDKCEPVFPH